MRALPRVGPTGPYQVIRFPVKVTVADGAGLRRVADRAAGVPAVPRAVPAAVVRDRCALVSPTWRDELDGFALGLAFAAVGIVELAPL